MAEASVPVLHPLDPRVRTVWRLSAGFVAAATALAALLAWRLAAAFSGPPWLPAAVALVALGVAWAVPQLRYRRWRYGLSDTHLEIRRGVLWTTISVIPLARLQFVDTKQGPLDRRFGLAALVVHTAAVGTSGTLPGLGVEVAADLRRRLAQLAGEADDDVGV